MTHQDRIRAEVCSLRRNPGEMARIVSEIGVARSSEADHRALSAAVAEIAGGNLSAPMRGCDESPLECIKRIVDIAVHREAAYNAGPQEEFEEDYADYVPQHRKAA